MSADFVCIIACIYVWALDTGCYTIEHARIRAESELWSSRHTRTAKSSREELDSLIIRGSLEQNALLVLLDARWSDMKPDSLN